MFPRLSLTLLISPSTAFALNISLDFTYDDYFTNSENPNGAAGVAALEAAADELSSLIGNSLNAIDTDRVTGTSGNTTATFTTSYRFSDPSNEEANITRSPVGIGADEIVIYVGAQSLEGLTFAHASPGSPQLGISKFGDEKDWVSAVAHAESSMNALFGRGDYDIQRLSTVTSFGNADANLNLNFGPVLGSMSFNDSPGEESDVRQSWAVNEEYWHYDHTTPVDSGKTDIYSVALHEMLHALGYGSSNAWGDFVFGEDWAGENVAELLGSGEFVLDEDGDHIRDGFSSPGFRDGESRSPVMSPTILSGERLEITELDVAFLRDMGLQIETVPEPSTFGLLTVGLLSLCRRRR